MEKGARGTTLTFVVQFESLLYRCDGSKHRQSVNSTLNIRSCTEFISQHLRYSSNLILGRNYERNHACSIPGKINKILIDLHLYHGGKDGEITDGGGGRGAFTLPITFNC